MNKGSGFDSGIIIKYRLFSNKKQKDNKVM